jgi:hypothetical protein
MPRQADDRIDLAQVLAALRDGDLDAAIETGLMQLDAQAMAEDERAPVQAAQDRLRAAWDARERYRARNARLARLAAERDARRAQQDPRSAKPALPAAAAAALARALAKASQRP